MKYNCVIAAWGKHEAELRGFLTRQSSRPALAEDILQETFLRAIAEGSRFCDLENPRAWLFRVARNQFIDHTRRADSRLATAELAEDVPDKVEQIPVVQTLDVCLPRALTRLNDEDREIIERCDLDGELQSKYAEDHDLSLAGAKSRIQRARKRLKSELVKLCKVNFDDAGNVCCFTSKDNRIC